MTGVTTDERAIAVSIDYLVGAVTGSENPDGSLDQVTCNQTRRVRAPT